MLSIWLSPKQWFPSLLSDCTCVRLSDRSLELRARRVTVSMIILLSTSYRPCRSGGDVPSLLCLAASRVRCSSTSGRTTIDHPPTSRTAKHSQRVATNQPEIEWGADVVPYIDIAIKYQLPIPEKQDPASPGLRRI